MSIHIPNLKQLWDIDNFIVQVYSPVLCPISCFYTLVALIVYIYNYSQNTDSFITIRNLWYNAFILITMKYFNFSSILIL